MGGGGWQWMVRQWDFAESMAMFLIDRRKLKEIAPNRERYLHDLSKQLGNRLRY